jgi:hypothetical protein
VLAAGEILHCLKAAAGQLHQRDALMTTAFKGIGGLPGAKVAQLQAVEAQKVGGWHSALKCGQSLTPLLQG